MIFKKRDKGSLTLETALVLPFFFFMFLFIFGYVGVLSARNQIRHALIQATKSLSMDSYITENTESLFENDGILGGEAGDKLHLWEGLGDLVMEVLRPTDPYFSSRNNWYGNSGAASQDNSNVSVVKTRFVSFVSGGGWFGESEANERLKTIGVVNGLNGMDFEYFVDNSGNLKVTVRYSLCSWFDFMGYGGIPMEDSAYAKMWGYNGPKAAPPTPSTTTS